MKTKFSFTIHSLLYNTEDLKGPIEQVLFAKQMAAKVGIHYPNCLCRVTFTNQSINKAFPGAVPLEETLLMGVERWDERIFHLYVRGKKTYLHIATGKFPARELTIHDEYGEAILLDKLSDNQIKEIFTRVWDAPESIEPIAQPFPDL